MYKLTRLSDGLVKQSNEVRWITWEEDRAKELTEDIAVGKSLLMSPLNVFFTWQTTIVTEIVENTLDRIEFKTKNSHYVLEHISNIDDDGNE